MNLIHYEREAQVKLEDRCQLWTS